MVEVYLEQQRKTLVFRDDEILSRADADDGSTTGPLVSCTQNPAALAFLAVRSLRVREQKVEKEIKELETELKNVGGYATQQLITESHERSKREIARKFLLLKREKAAYRGEDLGRDAVPAAAAGTTSSGEDVGKFPPCAPLPESAASSSKSRVDKNSRKNPAPSSSKRVFGLGGAVAGAKSSKIAALQSSISEDKAGERFEVLRKRAEQDYIDVQPQNDVLRVGGVEDDEYLHPRPRHDEELPHEQSVPSLSFLSKSNASINVSGAFSVGGDSSSSSGLPNRASGAAALDLSMFLTKRGAAAASSSSSASRNPKPAGEEQAIGRAPADEVDADPLARFLVRGGGGASSSSASRLPLRPGRSGADAAPKRRKKVDVGADDPHALHFNFQFEAAAEAPAENYAGHAMNSSGSRADEDDDEDDAELELDGVEYFSQGPISGAAPSGGTKAKQVGGAADALNDLLAQDVGAEDDFFANDDYALPCENSGKKPAIDLLARYGGGGGGVHGRNESAAASAIAPGAAPGAASKAHPVLPAPSPTDARSEMLQKLFESSSDEDG